jgi:VCBS repeat-containing protein
LDLNADGSFTYTPMDGFNGMDTFTYRANDGADNSNLATVNITIAPVNNAPLAVDDSYNTQVNLALVVVGPGVLLNDTDLDDDPLTAWLDSGPAHGTLNLNADGSFTYTPATGFIGVDTFTYHANDGLDDSNIATVQIMVSGYQIYLPALLRSY